ncbi:MAG: FAD-dependent oxidoreductase [Rhizobiaceae bacterium]
MHGLNIAVVGSGISGLSAAWLLGKKHNVTLFEADNRLGGHTNTVTMDVDGADVPVDTGFICFNSVSYPNLIKLFEHLNVPVHDTNMSFAASMANGAYEYSGGTYLGLFGQPSNLLSRQHWRMIKDILRFFKQAPASLHDLSDDESLSDYLSREGYSADFAKFHLLPMAAAIWSSKLEDMQNYPAKAFIRFFQNHGLLQVSGRPQWGTVSGGASGYIDKMLADTSVRLRSGAPVLGVKRQDNGVEITTASGTEQFDQIVIASHADQALKMLDDASPAESKLLGAFNYSRNRAVLHRDPRFMPRRRLTWASWNYMELSRQPGLSAGPDLCLTYWMNRLQNLNTKKDVFVTLNPPEWADINNVAASFDYMHPIFDAAAMGAQRQLWSLQGVNRTWFCGAHFGSGFHEDGLQSGLAVAEQLGNQRRPWTVENESGRIFLHPQAEQLEAAE